MVKHDTLLICSKVRENRQELRHVFSDAFHLLEAGDVRQMIQLLQQNLSCVAAVLLDVSRCEEEDLQWILDREQADLLDQVAVIVFTETDNPETLSYSFDYGAVSVIPMNYDRYAMLQRVENIVELSLHKRYLEALVEEQRRLLRHTSDTMVDALSSIIEYRSVESGQHILRIRHFTRILLEEVARSCPEYQLTQQTIDLICNASALHDIGKIAIPDGILLKPGPLTEAERKTMQTHTLTGCRILETLADMTDQEYLRYAHNICHYHHERWDGGGYPEGLRGEAIPICAQVVGLADVYDALTSKRVYKEAFSFAESVNMIFRGECGVFSPKLLDCFKHVTCQFEALAAEYADGRQPEKGAFHSELPSPEAEQSEDALDWLQGKYYALAHHINGLLLELNLDRKLFHLVYNPYPELASMKDVNTLEQIRDLLRNQFVHPSDRERMEWFVTQEIGRFLEKGLRRASYRFRANSSEPEGQLFELTLMRINPLDESRRTLMVLAKKLDPQDRAEGKVPQGPILFEGSYCCRNDEDFTLLDMGSSLELLAGYTLSEIREKFGGRLMELAHPDDRDLIRQEFARQLRRGAEVRLEHRILTKDGAVRWVYNQSRLATDAAGQEVIYSYVIDIGSLHREDDLLKQKLARYEMILAQTENVLFEWDITRDTVSFSDTWEKIFGYQPPDAGSGWSREWAHCLYPDDIPLLADCISSLKDGSPYEMTEVRMATARGRYLWCRFRATAVRDGRGALQKIIGIIINIDTEKQAEQALQSRANQDPLTKLLNKDAARKQAEEYFLRYSGETGGAMLIIDLDDFKQINDRNGHLFGDTVLVKVAQELRKLFRGQDIIARIGGDEFLVVIRGSIDENLLEQRCQQLQRSLRRAFGWHNLSLSCSIGIARAPAHGQSYYDLFRCADQALYRTKAGGKNGYTIYNPALDGYLSQATRPSPVGAPIDSDAEPDIVNDNIVRYAFRKLYSSQDMERSINELLGFIGRKINASRVYVFENSEDNRFCSNTYEWCSQGIPSEIHNLQNIDYEKDIPGYVDNFDEQGIFYCPDVALLSREVYDIVAPQGIKAMLHCAIRENGVFRGYIGFDDCWGPRMWTREQIELLTFFSEVLSMFLLRQRRQEKVQRQARELRFILDNQAAWIYVVDPQTHALRYVNASLREKYPQAQAGMTCYRVLKDRETPCAHCPLRMLEDRQNHTGLYRGKDGMPILLEAARIQWSGEDACMISGHRIPEE